jgi:hypothetical protein
VRIWRIGTHRVLGVQGLDETGHGAGPGVCPLPQGLAGTLNSGKEVLGDFLVCPLSKERPGEMQFICVALATQVHAKPYRF